MSVSIWSDAPDQGRRVVEPCLCAQMAECWSDVFEGRVSFADAAAELGDEASPECPVCGGTGLEAFAECPGLNWNNANARAVLGAMGLVAASEHVPFEKIPAESGPPPAEFDLAGEVSIAEARRAVMLGRNRALEPFARPTEYVYARPRASGGVVELRPVRAVVGGLDVAGIRIRIDEFAGFVAEAEQAGARTISWG